VTTQPDPAVLYPDVAARGSLAAALQAVAVEQGFSLPVTVRESDPLRHAVVPSAIPRREGLVLNAWHRERRWAISGCGQGKLLIEGNTQDLAEVARAAQAWRDGVPLADIREVAPFVELTGRFEVPDQSADQVVASEWHYLRKHAQDSDWPEYRALIEAAYAELKLRQFYPYTSHWSLRFSTTTGFPFSPDVVCLEATQGGTYVVRVRCMGEILGETDTAQDAVSLAVGHLPADLGPAVSGAYERQDH
jgi:Family of unknown function (DUF6193)